VLSFLKSLNSGPALTVASTDGAALGFDGRDAGGGGSVDDEAEEPEDTT
jgi:hypothetical protein